MSGTLHEANRMQASHYKRQLSLITLYNRNFKTDTRHQLRVEFTDVFSGANSMRQLYFALQVGLEHHRVRRGTFIRQKSTTGALQRFPVAIPVQNAATFPVTQVAGQSDHTVNTNPNTGNVILSDVKSNQISIRSRYRVPQAATDNFRLRPNVIGIANENRNNLTSAQTEPNPCHPCHPTSVQRPLLSYASSSSRPYDIRDAAPANLDGTSRTGVDQVLAFLSVCMPPMDNLLDRFVAYGCNNNENLLGVSVWTGAQIEELLHRIPPDENGEPLTLLQVFALRIHWQSYFVR